MGGNTEKVIDIKENQLLKIDQELLEILLQDKTTGKNIIWATDNYISHGDSYAPDKEILIELITSRNGNIIKPRVEKSKLEQQKRVKQKAEVFTPAWICNAQANLVDDAWFGRKAQFNIEDVATKTWKTLTDKIEFHINKTNPSYDVKVRCMNIRVFDLNNLVKYEEALKALVGEEYEEGYELDAEVKERIDAWYTNAESKVEGGTLVTRSYISKLTEIMNNITFADANNKTQLVEFLSLLLEQCEKADAE